MSCVAVRRILFFFDVAAGAVSRASTLVDVVSTRSGHTPSRAAYANGP